mmetsp:Transcript_9042/g.19140  ORF Transcript_9042/g.19140 Transcript_9042/m.19140 type:complete len:246 (-) Transcript_9042:467-1204(-)|eukprot:CAMPEP_0119485448 /NCGR_PEP_ID=MMETSP1344-20130328/12144_1 /TAXON_ID=236787 /ORGANISM="Florenciella parvula, Strain CCMP2471" /LENGTH=245 /DNA_ID=CAMNT_0007520123 /DNA_START=207 /DNA_END=944 /DNA_ORIENTATION=-
MAAEGGGSDGPKVLKILVLGDPGTGKSSIINRYVKGTFSEATSTTVGVDFGLKSLRVGGEEIRLQLWDIAGQDRINSNLLRVYYRDAFGVMLVYDISRPQTFETVSKWKATIDAVVEPVPGAQSLPVILVGNKSDVEVPETEADIGQSDAFYQYYLKNSAQAGKSQLDSDYLQGFCKDNGFVKWFDVSASDGTGVNEMMDFFTNVILKESATAFELRREQQAAFRPGQKRGGGEGGLLGSGGGCC